jgi:hypothetical protein
MWEVCDARPEAHADRQLGGRDPAEGKCLPRLKLEKGSSVFVTETPNGYVLTPYDPGAAEQIEAGREFMRE